MRFVTQYVYIYVAIGKTKLFIEETMVPTACYLLKYNNSLKHPAGLLPANFTGYGL